MDLRGRGGIAPPFFYEIVQSEEFDAMFSDLVPNPQLRDEIQFAFHAELPLDPDKFEKIEGTSVRRAVIKCSPPLRIFFSVSERTITLLQIHPME